MRLKLTLFLFTFCCYLAIGQQSREEIDLNRKYRIKNKTTWTVSYHYDTLNSERIKRSEEIFNQEGEIVEHKSLVLYGHGSDQCWLTFRIASDKEENKVISRNTKADCHFGSDSIFYFYNSLGLISKEIRFEKGNIDYSLLHIYDKDQRLIESRKLYSDKTLAYTTRYEYIDNGIAKVKRCSPDTKEENLVALYYFDKSGRKLKSKGIYSSGKHDGFTFYNYDTEGKLIEILERDSAGKKYLAQQFTYEYF